MNDHEILARLESATPDELSGLLRRPTESEVRVYRAYFGTERYESLRHRTLITRLRRAAKRGNVVILHGIMGGELTVSEQGRDKSVWMNPWRLAFGAVGWLRMNNGKSVYDVRATGILKKWYADQILELNSDWNVQTYWYDWRRDVDEIADDLLAKIGGWFGAEAPVNLVAHSMGGLVSRTYIARHPNRWNKGGKLIMLGTPNHGSFSIPQVITGAIDTVRKLALLDVTRNLEEITGILSDFPGALQMLPSPAIIPTMERLYQSSTWGWRVPQALLDRARRHHDLLAGVVDGERMFYIAGCNRRTYDDVRDWRELDSLDGYRTSNHGDGTVPHRLGFLEQNGERIPTWFIEEDHGALPNNGIVINATKMLLLQDTCNLSTTPEGARGSSSRALDVDETTQWPAEDARFMTIVDRLHVQSRAAGPAEDSPVSREEVEAAEIILRSFLAESEPNQGKTAVVGGRDKDSNQVIPPIEVALLRADLGALPATPAGEPPINAISVGHYIGVAPQNAELALDRAISGWTQGDSDDKLVLTALCRRGSIAAQLGQQYIVPDTYHPGRIAVLAGMGRPGGFAVPELTLVARELTWTMGRMHCEHLASVLIGAGVGNLTIQAAVAAWLHGLRRALADAHAVESPRLKRLTFVEYSPANFVRLHLALSQEIKRWSDSTGGWKITYLSPDESQLEIAKKDAEKQAVDRARWSIRQEMEGGTDLPLVKDPEPIRFTVNVSDRKYVYSVLTSEASIPQRTATVDPRLIEEINNQLVVAPSYAEQRDQGNLIGHMLIPADLRNVVVQPGVPTVLVVDATTARIHFEVAAFSPAAGNNEFCEEAFLGTAASLTRQLRTSFAPLPEPPIMAGHALRVLVVADPCREYPLPGAQEEGEAVAQLFEQFGERGPDVEVVRLLGPSEANRRTVLGYLINQHFDLVHYAGHCFFNADDPPRSGWLFGPNEVLTADELSHIDRVPRFVFSNACESGITPDRADQSNARVAPSFAEAFFAQGVGNFICTAWPVDDAAALAFATRVYQGLLGLLPSGPEPVHQAMRSARCEIAMLSYGGLATWGAYQHYGDPYFRISQPSALLSSQSSKTATRGSKRAKQKK